MASVKVGDTVTVPGDMYGLVKFVGPVAGKQGTFAGVQLANDFVTRGKNSGDVEGRFYFRTTVPGSGIFLPVEKAIKRAPAPVTTAGSTGAGPAAGRHTPATPTRLAAFNQGGRTSLATAAKPSFSQSLGPSAMRAGAASPTLKAMPRRESLARPISPIRKPAGLSLAAAATPGLATPGAVRSKSRQTTAVTPKARPSLAKSTIGTPSMYKTSTAKAPPLPSSAAARKFTQSLRLPPSGGGRGGGRAGSSIANQVSSPMLGPESSFDEVPDDEGADGGGGGGGGSGTGDNTPTPTPLGALAKRRDSAVSTQNRKHEAEKLRLQRMLDEKDRALQEQGLSISEMEKNLVELQKLMPGLGDGGMSGGSVRSSLLPDSDAADEDLPRDVVSLRAALREKNEKIKLLTAEFDANRADFRSTIDTLEMASNETERVYEKRVDELLDEVRHLQDRVEDVDTVAQQLRQLEDLVQELEEGLEDARRGEAEARAEVEFLRGEVERSRSELRRERERIKTEEQLNGHVSSDRRGLDTSNGHDIYRERLDELQAELDSKDDEIRGLKAIIHNLNSSANELSANSESKAARTTNGFPHKQPSANEGPEDKTASTYALQKQVRDLEALLQLKAAKEEQLEQEISQLRNSAQLSRFPVPGSSSSSSFGLNSGATRSSRSRTNSDDLRRNALKHFSSGTQVSQSTVVLSPPDERKEFYPNSSPPVQSLTAAVTPGTPLSGGGRGLDAASEAGKSEATSGSSAMLYCEICEETGHDILSCNNMISSSPSAASPSPSKTRTTAGTTTTSTKLQQQVHQPDPHSHSPHPSIDRPSPLISRKSNTSINSNPTQPPDLALPVLPTHNSYSSSTSTANAKLHAAASVDSISAEEMEEVKLEERAKANNDHDHGHDYGHANTDVHVNGDSTSSGAGAGADDTPPQQRQLKAPIEGTGDQAGMWAGKTSGVIDPNKWCALCERDGHDSVDCPIEDAF